MCHTDNGFPLQITGGAYRGLPGPIDDGRALPGPIDDGRALPGPTKDYRKNPSYQRLQGPAVHHQDGRLSETRTLCPGVLTHPARDGRDYRTPGPWRPDGTVGNTGLMVEIRPTGQSGLLDQAQPGLVRPSPSSNRICMAL